MLSLNKHTSTLACPGNNRLLLKIHLLHVHPATMSDWLLHTAVKQLRRTTFSAAAVAAAGAAAVAAAAARAACCCCSCCCQQPLVLQALFRLLVCSMSFCRSRTMLCRPCRRRSAATPASCTAAAAAGLAIWYNRNCVCLW